MGQDALGVGFQGEKPTPIGGFSPVWVWVFRGSGRAQCVRVATVWVWPRCGHGQDMGVSGEGVCPGGGVARRGMSVVWVCPGVGAHLLALGGCLDHVGAAAVDGSGQ